MSFITNLRRNGLMALTLSLFIGASGCSAFSDSTGTDVDKPTIDDPIKPITDDPTNPDVTDDPTDDVGGGITDQGSHCGIVVSCDDTDDGDKDDGTDDDGGVVGPPVDTNPDFDKDGFKADVDCNDKDPKVHPGATEDPIGAMATIDADCDGLPGGSIASGYFVAPDGNDANEGTAERPFATITRAFVAIAAPAPTFENRRTIFIINGATEIATQVIDSETALSAYTLLGGFNRDGLIYKRDFAKIPTISLTDKWSLSPRSNEGVGNVILSGLRINVSDKDHQGVLEVMNPSDVWMHQVVLEQSGVQPAVKFLGTGTEDKVRYTIDQSKIIHKGNTSSEKPTSNSIGILARTKLNQGVTLIITKSDIQAGSSKNGNSTAVWAASKRALFLNVRIADSKISSSVALSQKEQSSAIRLGYLDLEDGTNSASYVGDVVLERNYISGKEAQIKQVALDMHAPRSVSLRNNIIEQSSGKGTAVQIVKSAHWFEALNNTFRNYDLGLHINNAGESLQTKIANNIFEGSVTALAVVAIRYWCNSAMQLFSNNMFTPDNDYFADSQIANMPSGVLFMNTQGFTPEQTINESVLAKNMASKIGGNIVAIPKLTKDGHYAKGDSPGINKGMTLTADTVFVSSISDNAGVDLDIDRHKRTASWDIGADEWINNRLTYTSPGSAVSAQEELLKPRVITSPIDQKTNITSPILPNLLNGKVPTLMPSILPATNPEHPKPSE